MLRRVTHVVGKVHALRVLVAGRSAGVDIRLAQSRRSAQAGGHFDGLVGNEC